LRHLGALVALASLLFSLVLNAPNTAHAQGPIDGSLANDICPDFLVEILGIDVDIPDPGWVWVNSADRFRSVSGRVTKSKVTHTDFPAAHDSHDQNTLVIVDVGQEHVLSDVNKDDPSDPRSPDTIELEWEIGTFPSEGGDGPERTFPHWAWPSVGDRVWAEGNWIFDCGHGVDVNTGEECTSQESTCHRKTEIHPPRAIASMRNQTTILPGMTAPIAGVATDLYIHGNSGPVIDILTCSPTVMIGEGSCGFASPHRGTPINVNFTFDVQLPPRPTPTATLVTRVDLGPGNTLGVAPILQPMPASNPTVLRVTVPLSGTSAQPADVYARKIFAGWAAPPAVAFRHFRVTLELIDLHNDMELDPGDCDCTFFWVGLDRAPDEWHRLIDFEIPTDDDAGFGCFDHTNRLSDWDDDGGCGNGNLRFSGPVWDFLVPDGQSFTFRTHGYDQDCLDGMFGDHSLSITALAACYVGTADNDAYNDLSATFSAPGYSVGTVNRSNPGNEFDVTLRIEELPVDSDGDGLTDTVEVNTTHTNPLDPDTDDDGLNDGVEVNTTHTDPLDPDSDDDGLLDGAEVNTHHTDPLDPDTDNDGLTDGAEVNTHHTDPLDTDTDNDGLTDGAEVNTHHTDPLDADTDDDGLSDGAEVNTHHTDPLDPDTDDDGLNDGAEIACGMDPLDSDTDNDGIPDGQDSECAQNTVAAVPQEDYKDSGGGLRTAILAILDNVERDVAAGRDAQAIRSLEQLRTRLDGCGTTADANDWITDCASQILVRDLVDVLIANLD
jgi:hypothetical protein